MPIRHPLTEAQKERRRAASRRYYYSHQAACQEKARLRPRKKADPEYHRSYYKKNKDKMSSQQRAHYLANREKYLERQKERDRRDPEARWAYQIQHKFGLSVEQYRKMERSQNGLCFICKKPPGGRFRRLAVDHCHKSNVVRGLLCSRCNRALGYFQDDAAMLSRAIEYLQKGQ